jgi:hypothetical protein
VVSRVAALKGHESLIRSLGPLLVFQVGSAAFITDEIVTGDLGAGTFLNIAMFVVSAGVSVRDLLAEMKSGSVHEVEAIAGETLQGQS